MIREVKRRNLHPNTWPEVLPHLILADRVEKLILLHFLFAFHFSFFCVLAGKMKFSPSYQTKLKRQNKLKIHKKKICLERLIQDWACLRHFEETEQCNEVQTLKCLHCQAIVG